MQTCISESAYVYHTCTTSTDGYTKVMKGHESLLARDAQSTGYAGWDTLHSLLLYIIGNFGGELKFGCLAVCLYNHQI